ncbi:MAG: twin-arginine translocation signal domain-containing protein [Pseudomonadota bacterium]
MDRKGPQRVITGPAVESASGRKPPDQGRAGVSRRRFLRGVGLGALGLGIAPAFLRSARGDSLHHNGGLFSLGVVSGDPDAESVVLW